MASVAEDQAAPRGRDRAFPNTRQRGRNRALDSELGKSRAGAGATRAKTADCRNRLRISGCLRQRCLKARLFHSAHHCGNRCYRTASFDWPDSIGAWSLASIDSVRTDFDRHHGGSFNVKDNAQVCFDLCRINDTSVTSRKPVDFVGT